MKVTYIKNRDKQHNKVGNETQNASTRVSWATD